MMSKLRGAACILVAVAIGWQTPSARGECAFRFEGTNYSEPATWIVPYADSFFSDYEVLNEDYPIVYLVAETGETEAVNCTGESWRYTLASGGYATSLTFPDSKSVSTNTEVECPGLFNATGGDLLVSAIPDEKAVAASDSLFGRTIELALTCNQAETVAAADSCVEFKVNFTNSSPLPDPDIALYRFNDPAVPGLVMPPSGNFSPGDIQLNENNSIVQRDGSEVEVGCNGDKAEYLGEDGEWYFWFTGSDGNMYNLTHVFYATEQDHLNIATIQENWSPNLEVALYNRTVRLLIYCNNIEEREEGYVFFRVGDGNSSFDYTCDDVPCLCEGLDGNCTTASSAPYTAALQHGGWLGVGCSLAMVGFLTAFVGKWFLLSI